MKTLKIQLQHQLNQLQKHLKKLHDIIIDSEDTQTWDYDYYAQLLEPLEQAKTLLEAETGLLANLEEWQTFSPDE